MRLEQHRSLWGTFDYSDGKAAKAPFSEFEQVLDAVAKLGYHGIELPFKMCLGLGAERVKAELTKRNLSLSVMVFSDGVVVPGCPVGSFLWGGPYVGYSAPATSTELAAAARERTTSKSRLTPDAALTPTEQSVVDKHVVVFKEQVEGAYKIFGDSRKSKANGEDKGLLSVVVAHTAKDSFSIQMAASFFRQAIEFEQKGGFTVAHETHRHRFLYSPYMTRDFFLTYPDIKEKIRLCADFSHWVCVAETFPGPGDDPTAMSQDEAFDDAIRFIIPNVIHTHCRVGHSQGSQVNDPRSTENHSIVLAHEKWWDAVWQSQKERGLEMTTMIGEHGPPPYQPCGVGGDPLALIWDINHWVQLRRQKRFAEMFGAENTSKLVTSETQGCEPEISEVKRRRTE